jgi:hypothetical protein
LLLLLSCFLVSSGEKASLKRCTLNLVMATSCHILSDTTSIIIIKYLIWDSITSTYNQRLWYLQTGKGQYGPSRQKKKISSVLLQMTYLGGTHFRLWLFPVMTEIYCKLFLSHLRGMLK